MSPLHIDDTVRDILTSRVYDIAIETPLDFAPKLSSLRGSMVYLKREDLNHTGAHKLNHCMGEALLAKYLGKKKYKEMKSNVESKIN